MRVFFGPAIVTLFALASGTLWADEPAAVSLQPVLDEAQKLAGDPATQDNALAKPQAVACCRRPLACVTRPDIWNESETKTGPRP